jgi:hypothetical protein
MSAPEPFTVKTRRRRRPSRPATVRPTSVSSQGAGQAARWRRCGRRRRGRGRRGRGRWCRGREWGGRRRGCGRRRRAGWASGSASATESNVAVPRAVRRVRCDGQAGQNSSAHPKCGVASGIGVQVMPSAEVEALTAEPDRSMRRNTGTVPATLATLATWPPKLARSRTQMPDPGVTTAAIERGGRIERSGGTSRRPGHGRWCWSG